MARVLGIAEKTRYSSLVVLARKSDSKIAGTGKTQVAPRAVIGSFLR
jgi:hypothetical protein